MSYSQDRLQKIRNPELFNFDLSKPVRKYLWEITLNGDHFAYYNTKAQAKADAKLYSITVS